MPARLSLDPAVSLLLLALAALPAQGADPPQLWFGAGTNYSHVEDSEFDCSGMNLAVTGTFPVMLRLYGAFYSYEADDDSNTCDAGLLGDSDASETAAMAGWALPNGIFAAGGPSWVDVERTFRGAWGQDVGARVELGWTSRRRLRSVVGFDAVLFHTFNDVRDLGGLAFAVTFGNRP